MVLQLSCNTNKSEAEPEKRKSFLLYFNENDTLTYKKHPGLLGLKDTSLTHLTIPYYQKDSVSIGDVTGDSSKNGVMYRFGPRHLFIQSKINKKHRKQYLPKDSFKNYEIVKAPWKGYNINILDLSNPDSAFIVTVDYIDIVK